VRDEVQFCYEHPLGREKMDEIGIMVGGPARQDGEAAPAAGAMTAIPRAAAAIPAGRGAP